MIERKPAEVLACTCEQCGHQWNTLIEPKRCAGAKCKTTAWNRAKLQRGRPAKCQEPVNGQSGASHASKRVRKPRSQFPPVSAPPPQSEELCGRPQKTSNQKEKSNEGKSPRAAVHEQKQKYGAGKCLCLRGLMMLADGTTACPTCKLLPLKRRANGGSLSKRRKTDVPQTEAYRHIAARKKLRYAVKIGKIKRKPCEVCGDPNSQAHHDDYDKPLEVRWLCQSHHNEAHR
jgi:hypothetical protein